MLFLFYYNCDLFEKLLIVSISYRNICRGRVFSFLINYEVN